MNGTILNAVIKAFQFLQTPPVLLDQQGCVLNFESPDCYKLPTSISFDEPFPQFGRLYLSLCEAPNLTLSLPDQVGARDALKLAQILIDNLYRLHQEADDKQNAYLRLLTERLNPSEQDILLKNYQIPCNQARCVMILDLINIKQGNAEGILKENLPLAKDDVLLRYDQRQAILIKTMEDQSLNDLVEFASASQETLIQETALKMSIGIGCTITKADDLRRSYTEARSALNIGRIFQAHNNVFVYQKLVFERFLSEIPQQTAQRYYQLFFNPNTNRVLNAEMLDTIRIFFEKDLNLSDTARQLFVHRNTLVYRLDKLQKTLGLDLRKFKDAAAFKLLMDLEFCIQATMTSPDKGIS